MMGAAVLIPVSSGRPSPSAFPPHVTTQYCGVSPTAQPSLKPKLVPVFQAILCAELNRFQSPSSPGRITSCIALKVCQRDVESNGGSPDATSQLNCLTIDLRDG